MKLNNNIINIHLNIFFTSCLKFFQLMILNIISNFDFSDLHIDELLSSTEKAPGMKELLVAINIGKDSEDSLKPSSKTTSGQSSPLIIRGQLSPNTLNTLLKYSRNWSDI